MGRRMGETQGDAYEFMPLTTERFGVRTFIPGVVTDKGEHAWVAGATHPVLCGALSMTQQSPCVVSRHFLVFNRVLPRELPQ